MPDTFAGFLKKNLDALAKNGGTVRNSILNFAKSGKLEDASRIFNNLPFFEAVKNWGDVIEFIAKNDQFGIWFDAAIIRAYSDLLDKNGRIKSEIKTILNDNQVLDKSLEKSDVRTAIFSSYIANVVSLPVSGDRKLLDIPARDPDDPNTIPAVIFSRKNKELEDYLRNTDQVFVEALNNKKISGAFSRWSQNPNNDELFNELLSLKNQATLGLRRYLESWESFQYIKNQQAIGQDPIKSLCDALSQIQQLALLDQDSGGCKEWIALFKKTLNVEHPKEDDFKKLSFDKLIDLFRQVQEVAKKFSKSKPLFGIGGYKEQTHKLYNLVAETGISSSFEQLDKTNVHTIDSLSRQLQLMLESFGKIAKTTAPQAFFKPVEEEKKEKTGESSALDQSASPSEKLPKTNKH